MDFRVGVTTAPRRSPTLIKTVESLMSAGFEPIVFAEPGSCAVHLTECDRLGVPIVRRETTRGCYRNWIETADDLLDGDADAILIVQDDTVVHPQSRTFLEADLWPCERVGYVSLYCAKHYSQRWSVYRPDGELVSRHLTEQAANRTARRGGEGGGGGFEVKTEERPVGCHRTGTPSLWGACALVFQPRQLRRILDSKTCRGWTGAGGSKAERARRKADPKTIKNVDTMIGMAVSELHLEGRVYHPSLAQHIAKHSAVGHGDNSGRRRASHVVPDEVDPKAVFAAETGYVRYEADGRARRTGDPEYDAAVDWWHGLGHSPSWSIDLDSWHTLRDLLRHDMRTLEFGSGLSTRLIRGRVRDHLAIEQDRKVAIDSGALHCPLAGDWYEVRHQGPPLEGPPYDLILIDGPQGEGNRRGILSRIEPLCHADTVIVIDDVHRDAEWQLAHAIADRLNRPLGKRGRLGVIRPNVPAAATPTASQSELLQVGE
ncbi:class I SAM-dependent methyltransferase [Stratiformator vulcanicus]|uniref:Uncharacterized protein n=1 Tax=Stratiformator vulcanicus TaxID=2527980 RepID=A0A517R764_9PLAN|nr:class I SAM-dependent methyltransferase [Stratiformator vulcanicus]QDT39719.1 hypothetical protein Pan189_41280 [Stratiformator vulcanicus]